MADLELFDDEAPDVEKSRIILSVYEVVDGFIPNWELEIRENATMEEVLALRDGIELVRVQFDRMMDLVLGKMVAE